MLNSWVIGLCAVCRHARVIKSAKGSTFTMCDLAKSDRRFSKYPPLPVIECVGFQKNNQDDESSD
jgi:hypothetical protein